MAAGRARSAATYVTGMRADRSLNEEDTVTDRRDDDGVINNSQSASLDLDQGLAFQLDHAAARSWRPGRVNTTAMLNTTAMRPHTNTNTQVPHSAIRHRSQDHVRMMKDMIVSDGLGR